MLQLKDPVFMVEWGSDFGRADGRDPGRHDRITGAGVGIVKM
jgi:hypothetical protein